MKNSLSFKKTPLLNKSSRLTFGQYKGQTVGEVMKFDASYLVWLAENGIVQFEAWLLDDLYELEEEQDCTNLPEFMMDDDVWNGYESSDDPGSPRY